MEPNEIAAQLAGKLDDLGRVDCKRFFGGIGVTIDGIQVAMVMHDVAYFRVDSELRAGLESQGMTSFSFTGQGGRLVVVRSYYTIPEVLFDDSESFLQFARRSLAVAQEAAKKKRPSKRKRMS